MSNDMFIIDRDSIINGVPFQIVREFIDKHQKMIARYDELENYYKGKHRILSRGKEKQLANNRLVCNHAKYIVDMATGYLVGNPVSYEGENIENLQEWYKKADVSTQDMDLAKDASIYGRAFELVYFSSDKSPICKLANLSPKNTFIVYDDTVEHKELFSVYYFPIFDNDGTRKGFKCSVYTESQIVEYQTDINFFDTQSPKITENVFDLIPITEIYNNEECQGDFEQVISLIDAYNILQSDRVNDKEQFVDSILLLINASLGDDPEEESQTVKALKEQKILELGDDGDARWLTRTFDETSVEILRKSLEQDIHKYANVPCMTDENFVGNSSGIAMRYKLLGFEQITKIKERYFTEGLKRRLQLFSNAMSKKGMYFDPESVNITFTRNLPVNETEIASIISQLDGKVPAEILLAQLPFVKNPGEAMKQLNKERENDITYQKQKFGYIENAPVSNE